MDSKVQADHLVRMEIAEAAEAGAGRAQRVGTMSACRRQRAGSFWPVPPNHADNQGAAPVAPSVAGEGYITPQGFQAG